MYFMNGIHKRPNPTSSTVVVGPTSTSRCSLASGGSLRYTAQVTSVEQELNAEASELISAASIPASTKPLNPAGRSRVTSAGYAASADPPRMSAYNAEAMIPGSTKMNTGRIFRNPAKMVPVRAALTFLAASTRCTICWSVHQYQTPRIGAPNTMPVQGKLG